MNAAYLAWVASSRLRARLVIQGYRGQSARIPKEPIYFGVEMSKLDIVFGYTKKIEKFLETGFKAEGRGLHTKINSIEYLLPIALTKKVRWIATIRNNMAHTEGFEFDNIDDFKSTCEAVLSELEVISKEISLSGGQRTAPLQLSPKAQSKGIKSQSDSLIHRRIKGQRKEYSAYIDTSRSLPFNKSKRGIDNRYINNNMKKSNWKAMLAVVLFMIIGIIGIFRWKELSIILNTYNNYLNRESTPFTDQNSDKVNVENNRLYRNPPLKHQHRYH